MNCVGPGFAVLADVLESGVGGPQNVKVGEQVGESQGPVASARLGDNLKNTSFFVTVRLDNQKHPVQFLCHTNDGRVIFNACLQNNDF